ncbi:hypothetical protein MHYP_G00177050 [Metynnis hypsauchen]
MTQLARAHSQPLKFKTQRKSQGIGRTAGHKSKSQLNIRGSADPPGVVSHRTVTVFLSPSLTARHAAWEGGLWRGSSRSGHGGAFPLRSSTTAARFHSACLSKAENKGAVTDFRSGGATTHRSSAPSLSCTVHQAQQHEDSRLVLGAPSENPIKEEWIWMTCGCFA